VKLSLRLALAASIAVAAAAPFTATAHAWTCSEGAEAVCYALGTACREVPQKYQPLCTFY
jgi:hypothetical protein